MALVEVASPSVAVEVSVADTTVVVDAVSTNVEIALTGPPGPAGANGEPGPQGPPGDPATVPHYIHRQSMASAEWNVEHNLGRRPNVSVQDDGGSIILGSVRHVSDAVLVLTFRYPITGRADCS